MFDSDYIMSLSNPIPSFENTPQKIYLGGTLLDDFTYEYYYDNNSIFGLFFQQYKSSDVDNIYHPYIVN